jgi:hypothetical protein
MPDGHHLIRMERRLSGTAPPAGLTVEAGRTDVLLKGKLIRCHIPELPR